MKVKVVKVKVESVVASVVKVRVKMKVESVVASVLKVKV